MLLEGMYGGNSASGGGKIAFSSYKTDVLNIENGRRNKQHKFFIIFKKSRQNKYVSFVTLNSSQQVLNSTENNMS
jgi:glucose-6-phosphate isomerase